MVCSSRITTAQAFFLLVTLLISAGFSAAFAQTQKARATSGGDEDGPLFQE